MSSSRLFERNEPREEFAFKCRDLQGQLYSLVNPVHSEQVKLLLVECKQLCVDFPVFCDDHEAGGLLAAIISAVRTNVLDEACQQLAWQVATVIATLSTADILKNPTMATALEYIVACVVAEAKAQRRLRFGMPLMVRLLTMHRWSHGVYVSYPLKVACDELVAVCDLSDWWKFQFAAVTHAPVTDPERRRCFVHGLDKELCGLRCQYDCLIRQLEYERAALGDADHHHSGADVSPRHFTP